MTQQQYDVIVAIIRNGAPALANELIEALINLVNERNQLKSENEELKSKNNEEKEKK